MKVIVFIVLVMVGLLLLPDAYFYTFAKRFIRISGDGEYAMDNF